SGGWLADTIIPLSSFLGIWELYLVAIHFIISWVILRVSSRSFAFVSGLMWDWTIPAQAAYNPRLRPSHEAHLKVYWPLWTLTTFMELVMAFILPEATYTLVVCAKTTIMSILWFAKID
ncbi:hypothetical protein TREMEDRAFT_19024, partial [Tremella mesenterica DSM 1558]